MPRKPYALVMEFMRNPLSWFRVHPVAQAKVTDTSIEASEGEGEVRISDVRSRIAEHVIGSRCLPYARLGGILLRGDCLINGDTARHFRYRHDVCS